MSPPNPLPDWFVPLGRYHVGLQSRPTGAPKPAPKWAVDELNRFDAWNAWKTHGGARPAGIWARVPEWAWALRRDLLKTKTPPPTSTVQLGTFADPGVWLSAELRSDGWPPSEVARRAQSVGAKWAAIDIAVNPTGDYNLNVYADLALACSNVGIKLGCWAHNPNVASVASRLPKSAPFYIINREAPDQTEAGFLLELERLRPGLELAVVAGPFDAFPNPLVNKAGWEAETKPWLHLPMLVEAYTGENPNATPAAQNFQAVQRGFTRIACVVESNAAHGWTLEGIDAGEVHRVFGKAVSLYMLGTTSADDLLRFKAMAS